MRTREAEDVFEMGLIGAWKEGSRRQVVSSELATACQASAGTLRCSEATAIEEERAE